MIFGQVIFGLVIFGIACFFLLLATVNALFWPRLGEQLAPAALSVLIPARDEELNIAACLASVLAQPVAEVLVYDDHSSDRTAALVNAISDARLRLLPPVPLPAGWFGKTFACSQLAAAATSEWILFLDADARLFPHACERMLAEAARRRLTLLSCWPRFETRSFAESALMPMLNWVVFSIFPGPLSLVRGDVSLALAHGACMLFHRPTYESLGGHCAVAQEIFEDTRLAQHWRRNGQRALAVDGREAVTVRMYSGASEIWRGFRKNFYRGFRHPLNFFVFLALHFTIFLFPFLSFNWRACCAVLCARAVLLVRFRQSAWSLLFHPLGEVFLLALGIASWRAGAVEWKGRRYS